MKTTIYKILAIFLLIGTAFLNLHAQNSVMLLADVPSIFTTPTIPIDSGVIMSVSLPSSTCLNFGNVAVGQTSTQTITISNLPFSYGPLIISWTSIPAQFSVNLTSPVSIPIGQTQTFIVTFTPTAAGSNSPTWQTSNNSQNTNLHPYSVLLCGTGTCNLIKMNHPLTSFNFHDVRLTHVSALYITVKNLIVSCGNLNISLSTLSPPFSVTTTGTNTLPVPGGQQTFIVSFRPTSLGPFNTTLTITNNSSNEPNLYVIAFSGNGIPN